MNRWDLMELRASMCPLPLLSVKFYRMGEFLSPSRFDFETVRYKYYTLNHCRCQVLLAYLRCPSSCLSYSICSHLAKFVAKSEALVASVTPIIARIGARFLQVRVWWRVGSSLALKPRKAHKNISCQHALGLALAAQLWFQLDYLCSYRSLWACVSTETLVTRSLLSPQYHL